MRFFMIHLCLCLGLLSCKTTQTESHRGATGLTGNIGDKGNDGIDGKNCSSTEKSEGIEIKCDGQNPVLIPFAKDGSKGDEGEAGASCSIVKTETDGVTAMP